MAERRDVRGDLLHAAGVACALAAGFTAIVTFAVPDQERPRVLALSLALVSIIIFLAGWRRYKLMGRVDAVVLIGLDAWVLAIGGW